MWAISSGNGSNSTAFCATAGYLQVIAVALRLEKDFPLGFGEFADFRLNLLDAFDD
jgi:hypothetical protein